MALIKNDIHEMRTGKGILSDADVYALSDGWTPSTSYEANEYNRYGSTWDMFIKLGMDMQTLFYTTLLDLGEIEKVLTVCFFNNNKEQMRRVFDRQSSDEQKEKRYKYFLENTGIEYEKLVHRYTLNSIPQALRDDMISLHPEVEYDSSYFDEEERLACILRNKTSITDKEADSLTKMIMAGIPWGREESMNAKGLQFSRAIFNSYFAGYSMISFAEKLADNYDITYGDDEDLKEKVSKIKNFKAELKRTINTAIKDGLFFDEYIPLCNSKERDTHSGTTKLQHKTIMDRWLKAKEKVVDEIQGYIDTNHLVCEERTEYVFKTPVQTKTIITGTSLYEADDNLPFVEEYKQQVEILMNYGFLFEVMELRNIDEKYGQLLRYKTVTDKMSRIIGEEASASAQKYLDQINTNLEHLNRYFYAIQDQMSDDLFLKNTFDFPVEMFFGDFELNVSDVKEQSHLSLDIFEEKASKLLGAEWTNS